MLRNGEFHFITPQGVSALILRKMREVAENYLGTPREPWPIAGAVVTVPAYFTTAQKQATREACKIANLEIRTIINEPTAAVLLYHLEAVKRGQMPPGTSKLVLCGVVSSMHWLHNGIMHAPPQLSMCHTVALWHAACCGTDTPLHPMGAFVPEVSCSCQEYSPALHSSSVI